MSYNQCYNSQSTTQHRVQLLYLAYATLISMFYYYYYYLDHNSQK